MGSLQNPGFRVADIQVGKRDAAGEEVQVVYSKNPPIYAVYLSANRVGVEFADDPVKQQEQRASLMKTYILRSEINGLLESWEKDQQKQIHGFERMQAAALIAGLEGDVDGAETVLQSIRQRIVDERTSWARSIYMRAAAYACLIAIALSVVLSRTWIWDRLISFRDDYAQILWLAFAVGTVGAFFSIAIGINERTIRIDLRNRDNIWDAALRIVIGGISGTALVALLHKQIVIFGINGHHFSVTPKDWEMVMLAAFFAGFSERLVPDLLVKAQTETSKDQGGAQGPLPAKGPLKKVGDGAELNAANATPAVPTDDAEDRLDGCCDDVDPDKITPDSELPIATGRIASN